MELSLLNIDKLPVNVAVYKKEGDDFTFIAFNSAAEITDHINREELLGRKLTEVFPAVKEFGLFDVLQRVEKSGRDEVFDTAFYQDERISGWRKNKVVKLSDGSVAAFYQDCSSEKELETYTIKLEQKLSEGDKRLTLSKELQKSKQNLAKEQGKIIL